MGPMGLSHRSHESHKSHPLHDSSGFSSRSASSPLINSSGDRGVAPDLVLKLNKAVELSLWSQVFQKAYFHLVVINILVKIKKVNLQNSFAFRLFQGRSYADVHDATVLFGFMPGFYGVHAIRRKLLVVSAKICGWET